MGPLIYVETSVVSYLAASPSRDLIVAGHQQITHDWWKQRRPRFQLLVSELVLKEAGRGDPAMASLRLELLADIPVLETPESALALAEALVRRGPLPEKAGADAVHIAIAATHGVRYLMTWNCKHIANAEMRPQIERICRIHGCEPPVLCTPEELMGE